jgi:hypothetical protein
VKWNALLKGKPGLWPFHMPAVECTTQSKF